MKQEFDTRKHAREIDFKVKDKVKQKQTHKCFHLNHLNISTRSKRKYVNSIENY